MAYFNPKSIVLDIADNHGDATFLGIRSIELYKDTVLVDILSADITCYSTSHYASHTANLTFDTSLSKIGSWSTIQWLAASGTVTNQRLICVFDTLPEFNRLIINASHSSDVETDTGANNVVITLSDDAITDTTYNAAIANDTEIFDGVFLEHNGSAPDDQEVSIMILSDLEATLPALTMEAHGGAHLEASIPALTMTGEVVTNLIEMTCTIPSLSMESYTGLALEADIPALTMSAEGLNGILAQIDASIPVLKMSAYTGASLQATLKALTMTSLGSTTIPAIMEFSIPVLQANINASFDALTTLEGSLPSLQFKGTAFYSSLATMTCQMPSLDAKMSSITGLIASLEATIPRFRKVRMVSTEAEVNTLNANIPSLDFIASTPKADEEVLRHIEGQLR